MVRNIDGCINLFQEDKILFYPFAKSKILDVDVSSPTSRLLRIGHSCACIHHCLRMRQWQLLGEYLGPTECYGQRDTFIRRPWRP